MPLRLALDDLQVERQVRDRAEQGQADENPIALVTANVRFRKSVIGRIGSARDAPRHEEASRTDAEHREPERLDRAPGVHRPAEAREEHDRGQPPASSAAPEIVDRVVSARARAWKATRSRQAISPIGTLM